jgi:NAD(P)-dependent dehydrogenase (short-subunit alcohol dehydrogenase family)
MDRIDTPTPDAEAAAREARAIQARIDRKDAADAGGKDRPRAMQAGARNYPEPPMPRQHLKKPGLEADQELKPIYEAPYWKGSGKLEGFAALITGADSGIGRAVAGLFAREGCDIACAYLTESQDAEGTKRAVEAEGRRCILISGDIAEPGFAKTAVDATMTAFGRLDVLVNNAAFQEHADDIADLTDQHLQRTIQTNLAGMVMLSREAIPHMKPGSSIINTGSVTGIEGQKSLLDYSMTKGGIHAFTMSLAGQMVGKGIRVNAVAPGPVWTPLNPADKDRDGIAEFGSSVAMGRPAQPEEIAPAFVFLASPQSASYISGEILPVVGGPSS